MDTVQNDIRSQIIFKTLNELSSQYSCCIFANQVNVLPEANKFAIFQQIEALAHADILIGTSIMNIQIVLNSLTPKVKYYYMWEPEWIAFNNFQANQLQNIFYNPELRIITNNATDQNLMTKLFDQPCKMIKNWNVQDMEKLCQTFST